VVHRLIIITFFISGTTKEEKIKYKLKNHGHYFSEFLSEFLCESDIVTIAGAKSLCGCLPKILCQEIFQTLREGDSNNGLFYIDNKYRPVPLETHLIRIKGKSTMHTCSKMEEVCFQKVKESVLAGNQCMIFVHSRKDTTITATH